MREQSQEEYLARSVQIMVQALDTFAAGNLTIALAPERTDDDIARLYSTFTTTAAAMRLVIEQVSDSINATVKVCDDVSKAVDSVVQGAQHQANQAFMAEFALRQVTEVPVQNRAKTIAATDKANEAQDSAERGNNVVRQAIEGMTRITEAVQHSADVVEALGNSSQEIGGIITVRTYEKEVFVGKGLKPLVS